jgi:hypothetical protein
MIFILSISGPLLRRLSEAGMSRPYSNGGCPVKYLFLLYDNEGSMPVFGTPESEQQQQAYGEFYQDATQRGIFQSGDPVQGSNTATTVRVRNGSSDTTSGPFQSGAEQIIGFYVLDCKDADEAVATAAKIPAAQTGAVEVRPILSM